MTLLVLVNVIFNVRLMYSYTLAVHLFNALRTSQSPVVMSVNTRKL